MESSSNPIISSLSLFGPRNPYSLSNSFPLSTSLQVRAPLTVDDSEEEEIESNDDDNVSNDDEGEEEEEEGEKYDNGGPDYSLKPFIRPIAQLSWDSDDSNSDLLLIGSSEVDFEVESRGDLVEFVHGVTVDGKVSVAPRVGVFQEEEEDYDNGFEGFSKGFEESDLGASDDETAEKSSKAHIKEFNCDFDSCSVELLEEEEEEEDKIGSLKGCEESDLEENNEEVAEKSSKAEIERCNDIAVESCSEEFDLASCEEEEEDDDDDGCYDGFGSLKNCEAEFNEVAEESNECSVAAGSFSVGLFEGCEEESDLDPKKEEKLKLEPGIEHLCVEKKKKVESEDCEVAQENNGFEFFEACEEAGTERYLDRKKEFDEGSVGKFEIYVTNKMRSLGIESTDGSEFIRSETDVAIGDLENESHFEVTAESSFADKEESDMIDESGSVKSSEKKEEMVKFLRLVSRLGISLEDSKVTQVLDHFSSSESLKNGSYETDLDLSLNILVLGKSGVGKSSTINLIFGEKKAPVNAFEPATTSTKEISGTVNGVKIRILDTPGLKPHSNDQRSNRKALSIVRRRLKKFTPDIVFYLDRLDTDTSEVDFPIMNSITNSQGSSIWEKVVIVLSHSSSYPMDSPLGLPISKEVSAARKSNSILQSIGKSLKKSSSINLNLNLKFRVSLVENNSSMVSGDSNGRSELLLLCYSTKIFSLTKKKKLFCWPEIVRNDEKATLKVALDSLMFFELGNKAVISENDEIYCVLRNRASYRNFEAVGKKEDISCVLRNKVVVENGKKVAEKRNGSSPIPIGLAVLLQMLIYFLGLVDKQ